MSDTDDAAGDEGGSPVATAPAPIDTSDAASADGPAEQMSGRIRTAIAVGPFLFIWLLWWRLGDVFLHRPTTDLELDPGEALSLAGVGIGGRVLR